MNQPRTEPQGRTKEELCPQNLWLAWRGSHSVNILSLTIGGKTIRIGNQQPKGGENQEAVPTAASLFFFA